MAGQCRRAVDVEADAVIATKENAARNQTPIPIEASTSSAFDVEGEYDLVLANIQAHILKDLAPALIARLGRGGHLVLSGV